MHSQLEDRHYPSMRVIDPPRIMVDLKGKSIIRKMNLRKNL